MYLYLTIIFLAIGYSYMLFKTTIISHVLCISSISFPEVHHLSLSSPITERIVFHFRGYGTTFGGCLTWETLSYARFTHLLYCVYMEGLSLSDTHLAFHYSHGLHLFSLASHTRPPRLPPTPDHTALKPPPTAVKHLIYNHEFPELLKYAAHAQSLSARQDKYV